MDQKEFLRRLDEANNEREVRERIAAGNYNEIHKSLAQEWLRSKDEERSRSLEERREAREEETLAIANEALSVAKEANAIARSQSAAAWRAARYAMYAAIVATVAAITANKDEILALIFNSF